MSFHASNQNKIQILLTGGGTGGHIYPLLAVADYLQKAGEGLIEISYIGSFGNFGFEFENRNIKTYSIISSKIRRYFDLRNFLDIPKFFISLAQTLWLLYKIMPDIVFSKGGTGTLPVVFAAKFYFIPIMLHESDVPLSLTNKLSLMFAKKIAVSFESTIAECPQNKALLTGNPTRDDLTTDIPDVHGSKVYFNFNPNEPLILFLGGSQGSQRMNNFVFDNLELLIQEFQICHQVGKDNLKESEGIAKSIIARLGEFAKQRYVIKDYFNTNEMKIVLSAADIIISRAGSGAIFEIAAFGKPSILIPLKESASNHQSANAYEYAKTGAALVIEEENLQPHLLITQVKNLLQNPEKLKAMGECAKNFAKPNAAEIIGKELLKLKGVEIL